MSDLLVARRAALAGAAVGLRYFAALAELPRELKSDGSVVTEADRAVEDAIREVLGEARPDDAVLGEEAGLDLTVQVRGQVWDYAATSLIVEEAGGHFSGLDGQPRPAPGPALFARSAPYTPAHCRS
ncbi:hypothetical protein AB0J84_25215 [Micromonospora arborensis]|uniref:inositol monophosphatase family protein n=1 Tax=Micromonospora arborensis TaxID=2116518 RepID=UPI00342523EB